MRSTYLFRRTKSAPPAGKASICPRRLRCRPHRISRAHSRSRAETNAFQRRRIQPTTVGDRQTDDPAPRLCGEPAPPSLPCASNPPPDGLRGRLSSSQRTPRWRKPDSNHRSRGRRPASAWPSGRVRAAVCPLAGITRRRHKPVSKSSYHAGPMVRIRLPQRRVGCELDFRQFSDGCNPGEVGGDE